MTWCSRPGSARTSAGASRRSSVTPVVSNWPARLSAAVAATSARSHRRSASWRAAASAAARVCRSPTMRASRSTSSRREASSPGVGSATPSSSASWPACRTAIGVRSSWATSATRARRSCSCRSSVSAIWSKAVASSRSSPGAGICPTRAVRSPRPIARVAAISFPTGRVIRPATASPVSSASTAASPAAPAIARKSAVCRVWFAAARPEPVNLTTAAPTGVPRTTMAALPCGLAARSAKPRETATVRPAWSRISASAPTRAARSSTGSTSADVQLSWRSHAVPAAVAIALVSSARCRLARLATSAAANAAVSPASSAIAASATAANASASRSPIASPRVTGSGGPEPPSAIGRQAEPVAAAQHGLDDLRAGGIVLDLAAQVLHVRVNGALVPLELVSPHSVDELEP